MVHGRVVAARNVCSLASRTGSRARLGLLTLSLLLPAAACSPSAFSLRARAAQQAVHEAERAQAERHAPYELVLSRLYLEKAHEEAAEAHYAQALALLARCEQSALRARALAHAAPETGQ